MPITADQLQRAQLHQHNAAHDTNSHIRLIAGPGTGKSFALLLALRTWVLQVINNEQFKEPPIDYLDPELVTWDDFKEQWRQLIEGIQE